MILLKVFLALQASPILFIVLGLNGGTIALTFFHFFVVGGLMMACLIVARQLGGKTADLASAGRIRAKGWALGGANKMSG